MTSAGSPAYNGGLSAMPHWGNGAKPLVRGHDAILKLEYIKQTNMIFLNEN